jgi:hypothetical protein
MIGYKDLQREVEVAITDITLKDLAMQGENETIEKIEVVAEKELHR